MTGTGKWMLISPRLEERITYHLRMLSGGISLMGRVLVTYVIDDHKWLIYQERLKRAEFNLDNRLVFLDLKM